MNGLDLERINQNAAYRVWQKYSCLSDFYFVSDSGIEFDVSIVPDFSVIPSGAYELGINNPRHRNSPSDQKLRQTVFAIVAEFFRVNGDEAILYLTETGDGKQMFRNRLFIRWFNTFQEKANYVLHTAEGKMEGQDNFMALIALATNPRLDGIIEEFYETAALLFD